MGRHQRGPERGRSAARVAALQPAFWYPAWRSGWGMRPWRPAPVPGGRCSPWERPRSGRGITARSVAIRRPSRSSAISRTIASGPISVTGLPSISTRSTHQQQEQLLTPLPLLHQGPTGLQPRELQRGVDDGHRQLALHADSAAVTIGPSPRHPRACGCRTPPDTGVMVDVPALGDQPTRVIVDPVPGKGSWHPLAAARRCRRQPARPPPSAPSGAQPARTSAGQLATGRPRSPPW